MTASRSSRSPGFCAVAGALKTALAMRNDKNRASPVMPECVMRMPLSGCGGPDYTCRRRRRHRASTGASTGGCAGAPVVGRSRDIRTSSLVPIAADQGRLAIIHHQTLGKAMSDDDVKAELERLRRENAALKKGASTGIRMKVSEKGAVSIYGMGRFPVTLYKEQWVKLLDMADDIRAFIAANESQLKAKE